MAKYKLVNSPLTNELCGIYNTETNTSIPLAEDNTDYQEYLEWTKVSPMNVAEPADEVTE